MLDLRTLVPADSSALQDFLAAHRSHSMFLASNSRIAPLGTTGRREAGCYLGAFEEKSGALVGVAAHYEMGNIVVCAPGHAARLCAGLVRETGRPLSALVGPEPDVSAGLDALGLSAGPFVCDEPEGLFELDLDELRPPAALTEGAVHGRPMAAADFEAVLEWSIDYSVESIGLARSPKLRADSEARLRSYQPDEVWLLEREGRLVSMTRFNARLPDCVQIGGVWTPPELRGRGYARAVLASHLQTWRERGVTQAVLFTGDRNLPARAAYTALGFREVGRYRVCVFAEPQPPPSP